MTNYRMIYSNAADRATLSVSSQASTSLGVANLQKDAKSVVWRSSSAAAGVAPTAWIKQDYATPEIIGGAALYLTNLAPTDLARMRTTNEASATNLALWSEDFTNAAWAGTGAPAITSNYSTAPDGNNTADRIVFSGSGQSVLQATALATGVACAGAIFVKGTSGQTICIVAGGVSTLLTLNGTWQRLVSSGTSTGNTIGITTNSGATARDIQAWGAQLTTGALSSYYPTAGAAAARPVGYMDSWQSYDYDTGFITCVPDPGVTALLGYGGVNTFAYGGGLTGRFWLATPVTARAVRIDMIGNSLLGSYIEVSRLYCGNYYEGLTNVDWGGAIGFIDGTKNTRNDSGDLMSEVAPKWRKLTIPLSNLAPIERNTIWAVQRNNGNSIPVFFSLAPNADDPAFEQSCQLLGKFMTSPMTTFPAFQQFASTLELEEV